MQVAHILMMGKTYLNLIYALCCEDDSCYIVLSSFLNIRCFGSLVQLPSVLYLVTEVNISKDGAICLLDKYSTNRFDVQVGSV
jgi:hypothetical protein